METSWDTRQDSYHEASHGKKAYTTKRHLQPVGVEAHDRENHFCKRGKDLYELRRHPWDNTYMRSLKNMTSSQMGARRTFEKIQDIGSWYIVTLDGYIK